MTATDHTLTYNEAINQNLTLYTTSGEAVVIALSDLQAELLWGFRMTIITACQVGAAIATLVGMILITKPETRRHHVYWLNLFALVMVIIAEVFKCIYFLDGWFYAYPLITGDFTHIGAVPKAISIICGFALVFEVLAIELSLILQTRAICVSLPTFRRNLFLGTGCFLAVVAVAFRFAQATYTTIMSDIKAETIYLNSLWYARDITLAVSVVFFSSAFLVKLGRSICQRRILGITGFGPMQVLSIGFSQTMILPALFATLQFVDKQLAIDELVLTSVALSLPLTAMWAASVTQPSPKSMTRPSAMGVMVVRTVEQDTMASMSSGKVGSSFSMLPLSQQRTAA